MLKKLFSVFLLFFFVLTLAGCGQQASTGENKADTNKNAQTTNTGDQASTNYPISSVKTVADKLEIYYFHRTARCYSCKTIEQYVKETIEQKYNKQTSNGRIDFREINVDLAEDKEIAKKFQASGSSLFINRIIDNKDNIEQDTNVWRFLGDEAKFKSYLENKINSYLGM